MFTKKSIILSALVSFVGCVKLRTEEGLRDLEIATCKKVQEVAKVPELTLEEMKEIMHTRITIGEKHYGQTFAEVCFVDGDEQYIDKWLRARLNGFPFKSEPDNRGNARSLVKFYDDFIRGFIKKFGKKHVGETFSKICREDPKFIEWCRARIGESTFHWKKTPDNKKYATLLVEFFDAIKSEFKMQVPQQKVHFLSKATERLHKSLENQRMRAEGKIRKKKLISEAKYDEMQARIQKAAEMLKVFKAESSKSEAETQNICLNVQHVCSDIENISQSIKNSEYLH